MDSNVRSFLPAAAFYTQVPVLQTLTNLLIFPASSCEPDCSAAVRFLTKPLRFPTGGFSLARSVQNAKPRRPLFTLDKNLTISLRYFVVRSACLQTRSAASIGSQASGGAGKSEIRGANRVGLTPTGCIAPNASRAYGIERLSQSLTLRRHAA